MLLYRAARPHPQSLGPTLLKHPTPGNSNSKLRLSQLGLQSTPEYFPMNNQWMNFLTPSNETMHDDMEIGLNGIHVKVVIRRRSAAHEEHRADIEEETAKNVT